MALSLRLRTVPTDDDLLDLSRRNPGYQFERTAAGELVVTPTGSEGGRLEAQLIIQLGRWAERDGRGLVFSSSTGFRLPDGAVYAPDGSWVRQDRWEALSPQQRRTFAPLCPDVVFEIRSESQSRAELRAKMHAYIANGAQTAVLIDPEDHAVEIFRSGTEPKVLADPRTVALDPELRAFVLDLGPIFEV